MKTVVGISLACLLAIALVASGQERKPAAPAVKKKPPAAAEKPAVVKPAAEKPADPATSPETEDVATVLRAYRDAFNKHDAAAMAELWSPNGVYVDRETGERMTGSKAIADDLAATFKARPGLQLSAHASQIRFIKPDVVVVEGNAVSSAPDEEPGEMNFSAILVNQEGKWLIDSIEETAVVLPATPYDALQEMEWMVGHWVDETEDVLVDTTVRWTKNRAFLLRSYSIEQEGEEPREGTQVIGWDPVERRIRSWNFDSDGSFGEGEWFKNGEVWMCRISATLADGRVASGTQVFTKEDDDSYLVEMVGREIDGEPTPSNVAVRVVRIVEEAAAERTDGSKQASE
ncbi:MAG: SgcJ/EcaC family oxidoreductase [Pirellulales bacterium]